MIKSSVRGKIVVANLVCDRCGEVFVICSAITLDLAEEGLDASKHKDQNNGHECDKCRRARERAYDNYVLLHKPTSPRD